VKILQTHDDLNTQIRLLNRSRGTVGRKFAKTVFLARASRFNKNLRTFRCAVLPALRLTDVNEPGRSFPVIKNNRKTEGKKRTTQSTTKRFGGQVQF
jgi:hypothetical protein